LALYHTHIYYWGIEITQISVTKHAQSIIFQ